MSIRRGRTRGCTSPAASLRLFFHVVLLHFVLLHFVLLHFVLLHCILCHVVLFHVVLFHRVLRHGVLLHAVVLLHIVGESRRHGETGGDSGRQHGRNQSLFHHVSS